jgi:RNA-binding protein YhbY
MQSIGKVQLGKQGITENFIQTLKGHFEKYKNVKVSVMKSAGRDREKVRGYAEVILEKLGNHFTARVIGFTIVLKKWRKAVR